MPLGAAELSPQLRASWLGGRALGGWGCRSAKPSTIVCHPTANRPCVGHHQKCESDATLFVCYDAVTALRERFCQNAFARRGDGSRVRGLPLASPTRSADQLLLLDNGVRRAPCIAPGNCRLASIEGNGMAAAYGCTGAAAFLRFARHCGLRTALCHAQRTLF